MCVWYSVRGANSTPWFFRTGQVHIGKPGSNIEQALYIPPAPQDISWAFSNLENYINSTDRDPLVQLAIIHAQFEIIHPFWDGNGRIGRIILPLFLYSKGILSSPMFYISGYLEKHRERYYECLKWISEDGNWEDWIIFFLTATIEQSRENIDKVNKILALYEQNKEIIANITHSQFALQTVDAIFSNPIFSSTQFMNATKTQRKTTFTLLGQLEEAGMIKKIQTGRWRNPNIYIFQELVQITG